jgi:hypothetical protein
LWEYGADERSVTHAEAKPHIDTKAPPIASAVSGGPRSCLYAYMLQHSLFPSLLFQSQRSIGSGLDGFRPQPLNLSIPYRARLMNAARSRQGAGRNVPVYMCYGDMDDAVNPFEETVGVLREGGEVVVELRKVSGHGFDEEVGDECLGLREWLVETLL